MAFVLLMELLGVCVTGYVIGTISQLMANFSIRDTLYQEKMELVNRCAHFSCYAHATHERLTACWTHCHLRGTAHLMPRTSDCPLDAL